MSVYRIVLNLEADWDCKVHCGPAIPSVNPVFELGYRMIVMPHELAIQLGRVSEERLEELLAKVYAHSGIMLGGEPDLDGLSNEEWEAWLLADRERFGVIRSLCESKVNFGLAPDPLAGEQSDHGERP